MVVSMPSFSDVIQDQEQWIKKSEKEQSGNVVKRALI